MGTRERMNRGIISMVNALICLALWGAPCLAQTLPAGWGPPDFVVSDPTLEGVTAAMAPSPDGGIYFFGSIFDTDHYALFGRTAKPAIRNWGPISSLTDGTIDQIEPACGTAAGALCLAWIERSQYGSSGRVMFARAPIGSAWSAFSDLSGMQERLTSVALTALGSTAVLLWCDARTGTPNLYCRVSSDSGQSWSELKPITTKTTNCWYPSLAANSKGFYLTWEDCSAGVPEIYFAQSTNQGQSWSTPERLSLDDKFASERPRLAATENNLFIAWQDESASGYSVRLATRSVTGSWSTQRVTALSIDARLPQVTAMGKKLWISYQSESASGKADTIQLISSEDLGSTWSTAAPITNDADKGGSRAILMNDGAAAYMAWTDYGTTMPSLRFAMNPGPRNQIPARNWSDLP